MSKGSSRRKQQVSDEQMADSWAMAFEKGEEPTRDESAWEPIVSDGIELRWHELPCIITDWEFYPPGGIIGDPWPVRVKIAYENEEGTVCHHWVEQEEVSRHGL